LCGRLGAGFGLSSWRVWRWRWRGLGWRAEAGTDGFAPGFGAPGLNVFVAGVLDGLHEGLAKVGDDGGLFRFCLALRGGGEGSSQRDAEAGGGDAFAGESADFLPGEVLGFAAGEVIAEIGVGGARHTAAAAVSVKRTDTRTRGPWRDV
jgi:hypothetical protein